MNVTMYNVKQVILLLSPAFLTINKGKAIVPCGGEVLKPFFFKSLSSYSIIHFPSELAFCKINSLGGKKIHSKKNAACWQHSDQHIVA